MLELEHVSCGYGGQPVIQDLNLHVRPGEKLCIIGPNGCGKTTLLKAITSLIPFQGTIKLEGKEIRKMKWRELGRKVALVSQMPQLHYAYTVEEAVSFGRYAKSSSLFSYKSAEDRQAIRQAVQDAGLEKEKDKMIHQLSGGQYQRVFLARAFAQEPNLLLLDEPTNHLDLKHQYELLEKLNRWAEEGNRSVIGVFHDLNLATWFTSRTILMNRGAVVMDDVAGAIFKSKQINEVYGMDVQGAMLQVLERWK